jgi:hypothetical protein
VSRVLSSGFASAYPSPTDESVCTINWAAQQVVFPGDTSVDFATLDQLIPELQSKAQQVTSGGVVQSEAKVYKDDGTTLDITIKAAGTPGSGVTQMSTGAADVSPAKALSLADGLQKYVLDEITP